MKKQTLFILWGALFVLCAALGFVQNAEGAVKILMTLLSVTFFIPGALLLRLSYRTGDKDTALLVRDLSAASLVLTAVLLVANFLSALWPELLGNILHSMLVIVSAPMFCSGYWFLSLFLWACLMVTAAKLLKSRKNP